MKVLLDENLPHNLRSALNHHEVYTVDYLGWKGVTNGHLLRLAEESAFEVFVTADQNLEYQQNLAGRRVALVLLSAHKWEVILPYLQDIVAAVDAALEGTHQRVQCGVFRR